MLKRSLLKPKSLPKRPLKLKKGRLSVGKVGIKPKKVPKDTLAWIKAIPRGQHGSGHLQQRLWRLTSDLVRIWDWHQFGGKCVATGKQLASWNDGQAGHFKSWQKCNGIYKFDTSNIFLQSAYSNSFGDKDDWKRFEEEIVRRYGAHHLDYIEKENAKTPLKISNEWVLQTMKQRLEEMKVLKEKPPYYKRTTTLLEELK